MSPPRFPKLGSVANAKHGRSLFANSRRLLDIWPHFSESPIVQGFGWATLVELAFDNNRQVISPTSPLDPPLSASSTHGLARYDTIPGLLALHIRRGDFKGHCHDVLMRRSIGYTGFNSFPSLPDHWEIPQGISDVEKKSLYTRHCFPDIDMIVQRVEEVRKAEAQAGVTPLSQVYIMTNGSPSWVSKLKTALLARHAWTHIASSRDLMLTPEQKYVAQAVDMLVAQRAQVFVGNGVRRYYAWFLSVAADDHGSYMLVLDAEWHGSYAPDGERRPCECNATLVMACRSPTGACQTSRRGERLRERGCDLSLSSG